VFDGPGRNRTGLGCLIRILELLVVVSTRDNDNLVILNRVYRIYCELELNMRIHSKKRPRREKPEALSVP